MVDDDGKSEKKNSEKTKRISGKADRGNEMRIR